MVDSRPRFIAGLQYTAQTDVGMRRANNQDSHAVVLAQDEASWQDRGHVLMVADGMGAHAAGELASKLAVDGVPHLYQHYRDLPPLQALERAVGETNAEIHRRGRANPDFHNMGTTASVLVLSPQGALVGHVGDSRVYRLRGERLEQLTFDHSLLWELRAAGQISDNADLTKNIPKNVITRSLGPNPKVAVDVEGPFPLQLGDTFLLCSDGLSGQVRDEELGAILGTLTPEESATTLIDLANLRGGPDNITVIVAKVLDPSLTTAAKADAANRRRPRLAINPAAVVAAGVCWFLALVLWLNQLGMPAVVAALAGVGALLGAVLLGLRPFVKKAKAAPAVASNRGKSPYRNIVCKPGDDVVTTLSAIVQELRSAAQESQWRVDWTNFERHERAAQEAAHARRHADAVRSYAKALSFMMYELRNQQSRPSRRDGDAEFQY